MSKKYLLAIIPGILFILPITVLAYGIIFGHQYSDKQIEAASLLGTGGAVIIFLGCMFVDVLGDK